MFAEKKNGSFPTVSFPPEGEGVLKGHESVIVVNDSDKTAHIAVKLFFTDKDPYEKITWTVESGRVRCFRMNNLDDMCGYEVEREIQYAMKLSADTEIVVQYGRLDNRQTNLAYYTTLGF